MNFNDNTHMGILFALYVICIITYLCIFLYIDSTVYSIDILYNHENNCISSRYNGIEC